MQNRLIAARRDRDSRTTTADGLNFPGPRSFAILGRQTVVDEASLFTDWKRVFDTQGQAAILDRYREGLGILGDADTVVHTPLEMQITAGSRLLGHVFSERDDRYGADDGHIMYAPLIGETLADPDEVWFGPDGSKPAAYKFLRLYTVGTARGNDYVYHFAIAGRDGGIITAYRLSGGESAFNGKRRGRLIRAAYL